MARALALCRARVEHALAQLVVVLLRPVEREEAAAGAHPREGDARVAHVVLQHPVVPALRSAERAHIHRQPPGERAGQRGGRGKRRQQRPARVVCGSRAAAVTLTGAVYIIDHTENQLESSSG